MAKKVSPDKGKSIQWYIEEKTEGWRSELVTQVHTLITELAPEAKHSIKWAQPVYEQNGPFAFIRSSKKHVTLGFWRGTELDDADGLLEGSGDKMKHIKLKEGKEFPLDQIQTWVKTALELNATKGDPTKSS